MVRSSRDSSSTHASHNNCFIRRVHNSENRRTPYGTEHLHSPMRRHIHRRGYPSQISFQFTGTTHIHTAIAMMDAESFSLPHANGSFVMPTYAARPQYLRTSGYPSQISNVTPFTDTGVRISEYSSPENNPQPPLSFRYVPFTHVNEFTGVQTPAAGRGSSTAGCHQQTQNAGHTYVPGHNIGPAPFLHTDVAGPEYPRDWRYPQPSGGLYNGGFTSGAQMDAVRPGSVTGVQTPAVGLGPAGSSGVGYNQLSPIATSGFAGQTSQAPIVPEYDTQAAAPPPTLDQQLFPTSWATAANNAFAEDFLPAAVSGNFMHMLEPHF